MNAFRRRLGPERPASPPESYGVPRSAAGMIGWDEVAERLATARNYWLATVDTRHRPHAMPIWGVYVDDDPQIPICASRGQTHLLPSPRGVGPGR